MTVKHRIARFVVGAIAWSWAATAFGHSASDAYLSLETVAAARSGANGAKAANGAKGDSVIHGQWDIALRDLDFVLKLDADGDGRITWGELKARLPDIARYAFPQLAFAAGGAACRLQPVKTLVTDHADGTYVALFFDVVCPASTAGSRIGLDYRLFFAIDPSHRAIVVWRNGDATATALLSPENPKIASKTH